MNTIKKLVLQGQNLKGEVMQIRTCIPVEPMLNKIGLTSFWTNDKTTGEKKDDDRKVWILETE